jgi:hypothetical protein
MRHPAVIALGAGMLVVAVALAVPLWHLLAGRAPPVGRELPWQAQVRADGTLQVFGLVLGRDTLADAQARFGDGMQLALVARLGETGALEALVDPFNAGFVAGRLVLAFEVPAATLQRWRSATTRSQPMDGGTRRFFLSAADHQEARRAAIVGLSFVPGVRLSDADVRQRFGPPSAVVAQPPAAQVLLYPDRGLAATVAEGSRGVLQYVVPRDFDARLRSPLAAVAASSAR